MRIDCCTTRLFFLAVIALARGSAAGDISNSLSLVFNDGQGHTLPYRLFLPPGHDQPGVEFPLVVFLHGAGERGVNNSAQLAYIDGLIETTRTAHPAFLLAPQAPTNDYWGSNGVGGFSQATQLTLDVIEQLEQTYPIDTSRRYLTGLSMGGFGTWDLVAELPTMFAAAVPMSSWGDPSLANAYLDTRLWAFQGNVDSVTPPGPARRMIEAIRSAGGDPIYSEVLGDHGIWKPIYDDPTGELYNWLFDNTTPPIPQLTYDPADGTIRISAINAPGGSISSLRFSIRQPNATSLLGSLISQGLFNEGKAIALDTPSEVLLNGVPIPSSQFFSQTSTATYAYSQAAGFSGLLELPEFSRQGSRWSGSMKSRSSNFYNSPITQTQRRFFNVQVATVPEASARELLVLVVGAALCYRLRTGCTRSEIACR